MIRRNDCLSCSYFDSLIRRSRPFIVPGKKMTYYTCDMYPDEVDNDITMGRKHCLEYDGPMRREYPKCLDSGVIEISPGRFRK